MRHNSMSRHFRLSSELSGAISKRLQHAKNQLSVPGSFLINSKNIYIYIYIYIQSTPLKDTAREKSIGLAYSIYQE